jgi:hypothetical protein
MNKEKIAKNFYDKYFKSKGFKISSDKPLSEIVNPSNQVYKNDKK